MGSKLSFIIFNIAIISVAICDNYSEGAMLCKRLLTRLEKLGETETNSSSDIDSAIIYMKRKCNEFENAHKSIDLLRDLEPFTMHEERIKKTIEQANKLPDLDSLEQENDVYDLLKNKLRKT